MTNIAPQTKWNFTLRWVLGTSLGWILALLSIFPALGIWEILSSVMWQRFRETEWYQLWTGTLGNAIFALLILVALILMGIAIGLAQWQIALKGRIAKRIWISSTALIFVTGMVGFISGGLLSPVTFSSHAGNYSGFDTRLTINNNWLITTVLVGGMLGFMMGLPQWLILRRYFFKAGSWLLAVTVGSVAMFASLIIIVSIVGNAVISSMLSCCLSPVVFAAITGVALHNLLNRLKNAAL